MSDPAEAANAVLHFWFNELSEEQHWRKDAGLDRHIAERFGKVRETVLTSGAERWRDTPQTLLAAIILLDQFSRSIHRGSARAFEGDALARELTGVALDRGWVDTAPPARRRFYLMPLMHSEDIDDQERSAAEFRRLGERDLKYALLHYDQIKRFGRYPGRNKALGRVCTADERAMVERGETF